MLPPSAPQQVESAELFQKPKTWTKCSCRCTLPSRWHKVHLVGLVLLVCFCVSQKWGDYLARSFLATDLLIWFKFPSQLKWCCCHSFRCRADWSHLPTFSTQQHVEENTIHSANCLLKPSHPFLQLDWKSFSQPCAHGMRERETQQLCSVCTPKIRLIFNAYRSQFYSFNKKQMLWRGHWSL